jgi:hypothetical protein
MKYQPKLISMLAILLIATLACALPGSSNPITTLQTMIPDAAQTLVATTLPDFGSLGGETSAACQNDLYPVVVGASWSYSFDGTLPGSFIRSISALTADGFIDQDVFDSGVTRSGDWTCAAGSLTALDPGSGSPDSATVQSTGVDSTFQTTAMNGVTLPADVSAGTTWTQSFTIEGDQNIGGEIIPSKNVTSYNCTAGNEESVTVPAGTFTGRRVECLTDMTITITMLGSEFPTNITSTSTAWYAAGVGMVKTESLLGDGSITTIELTAYIIP